MNFDKILWKFLIDKRRMECYIFVIQGVFLPFVFNSLDYSVRIYPNDCINFKKEDSFIWKTNYLFAYLVQSGGFYQGFFCTFSCCQVLFGFMLQRAFFLMRTWRAVIPTPRHFARIMWLKVRRAPFTPTVRVALWYEGIVPTNYSRSAADLAMGLSREGIMNVRYVI